MPDKHEVGGSSPLGPTTKLKTSKKKKLAEGDLVLSSSEYRLKGKHKAKCKGRESQRGNSRFPRDISQLAKIGRWFESTWSYQRSEASQCRMHNAKCRMYDAQMFIENRIKYRNETDSCKIKYSEKE